MLDNRASSKRPECKNNLTIKVDYENGEPAGFVAYYPKAFYEGFVLFVAVDQNFRSRGIAKNLLGYAINDLKSKGSTIIRLQTRLINKPARKVYSGMGFEETWNDGEFIGYEKRLT